MQGSQYVSMEERSKIRNDLRSLMWMSDRRCGQKLGSKKSHIPDLISHIADRGLFDVSCLEGGSLPDGKLRHELVAEDLRRDLPHY